MREMYAPESKCVSDIRLISRSQEYQWRMMRLTDFSKCLKSKFCINMHNFDMY